MWRALAGWQPVFFVPQSFGNFQVGLMSVYPMEQVLHAVPHCILK